MKGKHVTVFGYMGKLNLSEVEREAFKRLGLLGAAGRDRKLSKARKSEIAKIAAAARWEGHTAKRRARLR